MQAFVGIDVGTQGVRVVVCAGPDADEEAGRVLTQATRPFPAGTTPSHLPAGHVEQDPGGWWTATVECLREVTEHIDPGRVAALCVTSTSGTIVLLGADGEPLTPALMYNDARAVDEAAEVQEAGRELAARMGYRFKPSFSLAKLLWLARHEPALVDCAAYVAHAADFISSRLSGRVGMSDTSNALKSGYDLSPLPGGGFVDRWPDFITDNLGLPADILPEVALPGQVVGQVTPRAASATGLQIGTPVVAGMTDGCASQIAAGAVAPGDWCSTLGTTLVVKGVTTDLIHDPLGRVYSHLHPEGYWLPGGASNVGGEILNSRFPSQDLSVLDEQARARSPSPFVTYPLARQGERFPFVDPTAEGFILPHPARDVWTQAAEPAEATLYAAYLEGVAYVERLAYETLGALGATVGDTIHVVGGGARSDAWLQIRADVLGRQLARPAETGAAMGAAILAASLVCFDGVISAAQILVRIERRVLPRLERAPAYAERYETFLKACQARGYIDR